MSDMAADIANNPIPKKFVDRAKSLGMSGVTLHFSGGSDEGFLHVSTIDHEYNPENRIEKNRLCDDIEIWAMNKFYYNGAGDGHEYGDDIKYDFEEGTVELSEWWTTREYGASVEMEMECAEGPDDE